MRKFYNVALTQNPQLMKPKLCHEWPRICSTCLRHFPGLSSFMTYHRVCNHINTMGATIGARTAYSSGALEFTPGF